MSDGNGNGEGPAAFWYTREWTNAAGERITERRKEGWQAGSVVPRFVGHAQVRPRPQPTTPQGLAVPANRAYPYQFAIEANGIREAFEKFRGCFEKSRPEAERQIKAMATKQAIAAPGQAPPDFRRTSFIV